MNDLAAFAKLAQALGPWRGQLVFIGGWGHRLHTLHPKANKLEHQPVFTRDTDLAFTNKAPIDGDIKAALTAQGFHETLTGEHKPPVAHYSLGEASGGFYAEFLTPLAGSGTKRNGKPDATLAKAGISAQKIRHLDILLVDPWVITVGPHNGIPVPSPMDLQVANPLCFMVQKLLIKKDRKPAKHAQDLLYIYDTIQLFGNALPEFKESWEAVVKPALQAAGDTVLRECSATFSKVSDPMREATRIPQDRRISPEQLQATCQYAFQRIFGL
ncbi:MAG: hypothetical protein JWP29_3443 [Rhodoferax sp.]|nr:hypothetical protein [Rhodoferax sp.]